MVTDHGVLYGYVVDPAASQPSKETSGVFPLMEKLDFLFAFSGVDNCWETHPSALTNIILCLTTIFATLLALYSVSEAIFMRAIIIPVMKLPWERFQILIFCMVSFHSCHYALFFLLYCRKFS